MSWIGKREIAVVSACLKADGSPALVLNEILATEREVENGIHFYWAEAELLEAGYSPDFVHFDEFEAPPYLHRAVRRHLVSAQHENHPLEEAACPA
jgi:hypothetical protein